MTTLQRISLSAALGRITASIQFVAGIATVAGLALRRARPDTRRAGTLLLATLGMLLGPLWLTLERIAPEERVAADTEDKGERHAQSLNWSGRRGGLRRRWRSQPRLGGSTLGAGPGPAQAGLVAAAAALRRGFALSTAGQRRASPASASLSPYARFSTRGMIGRTPCQRSMRRTPRTSAHGVAWTHSSRRYRHEGIAVRPNEPDTSPAHQGVPAVLNRSANYDQVADVLGRPEPQAAPGAGGWRSRPHRSLILANRRFPRASASVCVVAAC